MAVQLYEPIWSARGLRPLEKLVLLRIADRVNGDQYARFLKGGAERPGATPGLRSLAADCGLSKQGVANILERLSGAGVLLIEQSVARRPPMYFVLADALPAAATVPPDRTRRVPPRRTPEPLQSVAEEAPCPTAHLSPCPIAPSPVSHPVRAGVPPGGTKPVQPEDQPDVQPDVPPTDNKPTAAAASVGVLEGGPDYGELAMAALIDAVRRHRRRDSDFVYGILARRCALQEPPLPCSPEIARRFIESAQADYDQVESVRRMAARSGRP